MSLTRTMFVLLTIGCGLVVTPREYSFDQDPFIFPSETNLDPSAYYIHDYGTGIHILQFENTGNLLWFNCIDSCFETSKFKTLPKDTHRYRIQGDTLLMEVFADSYHGFEHWEGLITKDSIKFFSFKGRPRNLVYHRLKED